MEIRSYQKSASKTDQVPRTKGKGIIVPLLGLAGEVGSLLVEYKKHLRDGKAHRLFKEHISEELGDILWYVANVATKFDIDLGEIARENIHKTLNRWPITADPQKKLKFASHLLDEDYPNHEQIPRKFIITFKEVISTGKRKIKLFRNGQSVGDDLTDNAYYDDGYRFHDVFHLSYAAVLGWSPVTRQILKCKRRSNPEVDEIEDGGRAIVIEEATAALVYDYAKKHNLLQKVHALDYRLLKTINDLTSELEVHIRSSAEWEKAIIKGFKVWRLMKQNRGGTVSVDMNRQKISYKKP